jgi:hypothetical protein
MEEREIRSRATRLHFSVLLCLYAPFLLFVCARFTIIDRESMYKTSRLDASYLDHVTRFIAAAKRHRLRLKREHTICPCNSCKNLLAHEDNKVKSHLITYGFVKDYTV